MNIDTYHYAFNIKNSCDVFRKPIYQYYKSKLGWLKGIDMQQKQSRAFHLYPKVTKKTSLDRRLSFFFPKWCANTIGLNKCCVCSKLFSPGTGQAITFLEQIHLPG